MAIKGISERRRLPRQGKIKIGEKIQKENRSGKIVEYPVALDHFKVPEEVAVIYGQDPKELDIIFPVNDLEQIFPQYMKKYGKVGLHCKGDGETGTAMIDGEMVERTCDPDDPWCKGCQPKGTLSYIVPKVSSMRVYQTTTGGWNSIVNINSSLDMIRGMTGGKIAFIPLKLKIEPHEGTIIADGKQFKKTVFVLQVDIEGTMADFIAQHRRTALPPSANVLAIQAAGQDFIGILNRSKEQQSAEEASLVGQEEDPEEQLENIHPIYAAGLAKGLTNDEITILVWTASKGKTNSLEKASEKAVDMMIKSINDNDYDALRGIVKERQAGYAEWLIAQENN